MNIKEIANLNLEISSDFIFHTFDEVTYLYNVKHKFDRLELNPVEYDILSAINNLHNVNATWEFIKKVYQIPNGSIEAEDLFCKCILKYRNFTVLREGIESIAIYGEYKKTYPLSISIELTNRCNFKCTHCYKEADATKSCFLKKESILEFLNRIEGKVHSIEFTGGEPTLHPNFEEIVHAAKVSKLCLLSNGSQLHRFPDVLLQKFNFMSISLYGYNQEEYLRYTKAPLFSSVCQNIKHINELEIPNVVSIILRHSNITKLDQFMDVLVSLGVKMVRFGLTQKVGRNTGTNDTWDLLPEDYDLFESKFAELKKSYPEIKFNEFDCRENLILKQNGYIIPQIQCFAGTRIIAISEKGYVRPCIMMPQLYFENLTWREYLDLIEKGKTYDYSDAIRKCEKDFHAQKRCLSDICPRGFIKATL